MLVLSRKVGEKLIIGGNIEVTISRIEGNRTTLCVDAPREISVRRGELKEKEVSQDSNLGDQE